MQSSTAVVLRSAAIILLCTWSAAEAGKKKYKEKAGPPPYEYYRIMGDPVLQWSPADPALRGAGARLDWEFLGAKPIAFEYWSGIDDASGRVASIAVHPTDPAIVYAASASGGLWKTTDAGLTWTPLTDSLPSLNCGWVALDPGDPDIVYLGTGEYATGASGAGLFRSVDAGLTWTQIATSSQVGTTVSRIVVDHADGSIIHVAGNSGITRSTNGGASWSALQLSNVSDVVMHPTNSSILYCGRRSDGVYQSVDSGATWTRLSGGLPTSSDIRRINLALSQSNPLVLYAGIVNSSSGLFGFYKTIDGGANWASMTNTPNYPSPQGNYDHFVGCDPTDENVVYAGGVFPSYAPAGVIKSVNGANTWTDITIGVFGGQLHPDQHCIAFGSDGTVWIGNDGGVWKSTSGGAEWINCNASLAVTQNYQIALHPTDREQLMGGTQDNGTIARYGDTLIWPQVLGGDGGFAAYDRDDPLTFYTTYVRLAIFRFVNGSYNATITGPWAGVDSVGFIAPLVMDPNDTRVLLGGTTRIWRTLNARANPVTWTAISPHINGGSGVLSAIAVARGRSNIIYVGSTSGRLTVTTDTVNWIDRSAGLPLFVAIGDIVIDPADPQHAFVCSYATSGGRVFETFDAGATWVSRTGNLPTGRSGRALAIDWRTVPPRLFVGTGSGVFASYDGGTTWIAENVDLPNVNIGDLQIDALQDYLYVGTYGRGAWRTPLPCLPGDFDFDDVVNADDVPLFVAALLAPTLMSEQLCAGDLNEDGLVNGDDIRLFVVRVLSP